MVGYFVGSMLTLPFINALWIGRMPVIALVQVPKIGLANWILRNVAVPTIKMLGLSKDAPSPDYILTKPYALVAAYDFGIGISAK